MSAAAQLQPSALRVAGRGYSQIPNSLVENLAVLSHAELALALIVLRREDKPLSDETWVKWTGLKPRMKNYAIAGLKARNVLRIEGQGEKARFVFERGGWQDYVRNMPRVADRPTTLGRRKGVPAKPGQMVHPDCRERGCMRMAEENGGISLVPCSAVQPVANPSPSCPLPPAAIQKTQAVEKQGGKLAVVQPVAQHDPAWALTLGAIRQYFPAVESEFVQRLVTIAKSRFLSLTDQELADAVVGAWGRKNVKGNRRQESEGLFIKTVPEVLAEKRRTKVGRETQDVVTRDITGALGAAVEAIEAQGGEFLKHVAAVKSGIELVTWGEFEKADHALTETQRAIVATGDAALSKTQRAEVAAAVDAFVLHYDPKKRLPDSTIAEIRLRQRQREILKIFNLRELRAF